MEHKIQVVKMCESSGNIQFFVRSYNSGNQETLSYTCHQTKFLDADKHECLITECLKRAWWDAGMLARYFSIPNDEIQFCLMSDDEISKIKTFRNINRTKKNGEPFRKS